MPGMTMIEVSPDYELAAWLAKFHKSEERGVRGSETSTPA
jgi:hypothetical protein